MQVGTLRSATFLGVLLVLVWRAYMKELSDIVL
jgi:hypothetical protein